MIVPFQLCTFLLLAISFQYSCRSKLLGNLIGLSQLLKFVADEAGMQAGSLTVISTHATTTQQCKASVTEIRKLIDDCSAAIHSKVIA